MTSTDTTTMAALAKRIHDRINELDQRESEGERFPEKWDGVQADLESLVPRIAAESRREGDAYDVISHDAGIALRHFVEGFSTHAAALLISVMLPLRAVAAGEQLAEELDDYVHNGLDRIQGEPNEAPRYQDAKAGSSAAGDGSELALRIIDEVGDLGPTSAAKLREAKDAFDAAESDLGFIWIRNYNDADRFAGGLAALEAGYDLAHEAARMLRGEA